MESRELFKFDPFDLNAMRKLMEQYGDSQSMFWGSNEQGERVTFSIYHDKIITSTYQHNDWVRVNTYHWDGTTEETYCK